MKKTMIYLTDIEKKVFDFFVSSSALIEIEKDKPAVNRIGIKNGALKELLGIISHDQAEAYCFLDEFIEKLERARIIKCVGRRHDDKRIPIMQIEIDFSKVQVVDVAKAQEDIMVEPKLEITLPMFQARVQELRTAAHGGAEEISALGREIKAKIEAGESLDQSLVNRYNALKSAPQKSVEELAAIQTKLSAYEMVIADLSGQSTVDVQQTKKNLGVVKKKKTNKTEEHSEEEKLAIAWFNYVRDPSAWVLSVKIAEIVVMNETFRTISHVRSILSASANKVQRNSGAEKFKGLFESRELNKDDRGKYDPRVRLLYRLSKAGEQFISEYTAKKQ